MLCLVASLCRAGEPAPSRWEERVAEPPADTRILKIIHNWPDAPAAQDQQRRRLRDQGFGGVVCNVSSDQYLESAAKWQAFTRAVTEAKRTGMAMWLYDERGYPSGNAGGLTLRDHPEWEARGLLVADTESRGGPVSVTSPPGTLVLARAYPAPEGVLDLAQGIDLAGRVRDGQLAWEAPAGRWRVLVITEGRLYEGTHAEGNLHARIPYPNLLQAEPTARFIELTYDAYATHLGTDLARYFEATFTDEPSLMSLFLRPMPYRPLPWAPGFPAEFARRRGQAWDPGRLPALVAEAGPGTSKTRWAYWQTVGELVAEHFFGQIQTRCRALGVPSGGHLLAEEGLVGHVPLYGDFFGCLRRLDAPSMDCLTSVPGEVPWLVARLVSSAAELEGRTLVMSETSDHGQVYRPAGDTRPRRVVTEAEIRGTCNRLIVAGVNTITSYYSFSGLEDAALRRLNDWVGRCCAAMRGGHQVAEIALLYPVESLWIRFVPSRHQTREAAAAARIENLFRSAAEGLFAARRDLTVIDSRTLAGAGVASGALVQGPRQWRVLVLPGVDTLPLGAWENLARFVRGGGVAVALGALPAHSETEFPSARVQALARELFGDVGDAAPAPRVEAHPAGGAGIVLPRGSESLLPAVLEGLLDREVTVEPAESPVRITHRRIEGRDVFFVINDSGQPWSGDLTFAASGPGERWDPATGTSVAVEAGKAGALRLEPHGAAVFRFAAIPLPRRHAAVSGPLPGLVSQPLPVVRPTPLRGEFVRAELTPDQGRSQPEHPVWRVAGTLTKGGVDTFLFAQFHYPEPIDLSSAGHLAVASWVPEGQSTPNQVLVILREEGGGDFLVETGRSLAEAGREENLIPFGRFQLAGWSQDADGVLDRRRIQDIRIGWGGYLGAEGERVEFSVGAPRAGR